MSRRIHEQYRPHPWHRLSIGRNPPIFLNAFIEITPLDGIKYEIDKESGYLTVSRPQLTSSLPPASYGFIPKTYCDKHVSALSKNAKRGDGDPLDVCVLSERNISRSEVIMPVKVIGGIRLLDHEEADDKIIAVLESDPYWKHINDISEIPMVLKSRLEHYFLTYKWTPGEQAKTEIEETYGLESAKRVIEASILDYEDNYL